MSSKYAITCTIPKLPYISVFLWTDSLILWIVSILHILSWEAGEPCIVLSEPPSTTLTTSVTHFWVPMRYINSLIYILGWYMSSIPIPWYHRMENPSHTPLIPMPCHLPYHVTLYHTIWPHTISFDLIPYHLTPYHAMRGIWGAFNQIWEVILQGEILVHWAPSFVDLKTDINSHKEMAVDGRIYRCMCTCFLTASFEPNTLSVPIIFW